MNKQRMLMLADLLDQLKPTKFNMGNWFSVCTSSEYLGVDEKDLDVKHEYLEFKDNRVQVMNGYDCNSAACIAGWAVVMKNDFLLDRPGSVTLDHNPFSNVYPILEEAAEYLGISSNEASRLFLNEYDSIWEEYEEELLSVGGYRVGWDNISLEKITPKMAAYAVRKIVNEEWEL